MNRLEKMMNEKNKGPTPSIKAQYHYWQAFILSFYAPRLYVDVGNKWRGFGLLYLLLLVSLLCIPFSIRFIMAFNVYFTDKIVDPIRLLPPIYIQNGEVQFDMPMPYLIKNDKGQVVSIIDTTGTLEGIDSRFQDLTVLFLKKEVLLRTSYPDFVKDMSTSPSLQEDTVYKHTFQPGSNEVFDAKEYLQRNKVSFIKRAIDIAIYAMVVGFFYSFLVVFLPFLAILGQAIAFIFFSFKIKFKESCRLIAVGATPALLIFGAYLTRYTLTKSTAIAFVALIALYYCYGVASLKWARTQVAIR